MDRLRSKDTRLITGSRVFRASLVALGIIVVGVTAKEAVAFMDDALRPQYVVNGNANSLFPEPTPEWQRPTDWRRK